METIDEFKRQQAHTVNLLKQLLDFIQEGERYGIEIEPKLKLKIETGIKTTSDDKLKVVLIGPYSEGKTSLIAAWSEKYDEDTMKINQKESSDEVVVYPKEDFDLIDTPGLFGFKENINKERYRDITRKYISEAHLVLYVMNPNNPIKESHKEELLWLFNDLSLLPRTVFVLSRFDEEVDIEDEDDYKKGLEIKRKNIISRLRDFSFDINDDITIVAVSPNPFNKGIQKYWLSNLDKFRELSHIELLQKATTDKIKAAGTNAALIEAAKKSIISDILMRKLPVAIDKDEKTNAECDRLRQVCDEVEEERGKTHSRLSEMRVELRDFISELFTSLILQVKGRSIDTIDDFFERNIGNEGIVLSTKIKNEFERQLGGAAPRINQMQLTLNAGVQQYYNVMGSVIGDYALKGIKTGGQFLAHGVNITNVNVLAARNFIMPAFKFKPWGAVKLANNLNKAIPIIGTSISIVFEMWDSYSKKKKEQKFQEAIDDIVSKFEQQRKEYLDFLDDDKFIGECFPNFISLEKQLEGLNADLSEKQSQHEKFKKWRERGEAIDAEFKIIL